MEQKKTFYREFEVFSKRTPSSPFLHQFSLLAPNAEMAMVMAQENFMRREPVADIWVVERENIHGLSLEEKAALGRLDNKDYRETKGYGYLKKKWRYYQQKMFDEKEILSWSGGNKHD
ncbi:1,2-phenylacetyl-CoA epoxidase subunit PaaB [Neobacillus kokaensis]|uniref:Phenylacetate-CoA oxygenase n=1 Tax=Neobacillus kokaensis TaxID=2759023 RepID=A0ABQ3MZ80_9BACI|nr:1,2-phenylacetyl-CoA epoxidase subunit PaaB [Neobacillus kokaensis]GHH97099.1 hypothetical protein AM1BK_06420 [Neobacillus kokaensis]